MSIVRENGRERNAFPPVSHGKSCLFALLVKLLGVIEHLALGVRVEHDLLRRAVVEDAQGVRPRLDVFSAGVLVDVPRVAHALDGVLGKHDSVGHVFALRVAAGPHHAAGGGVTPLVVQKVHTRAERGVGREHERAAVLERGDDLGRVGAVGLGGLEVVVGDDHVAVGHELRRVVLGGVGGRVLDLGLKVAGEQVADLRVAVEDGVDFEVEPHHARGLLGVAAHERVGVAHVELRRRREAVVAHDRAQRAHARQDALGAAAEAVVAVGHGRADGDLVVGGHDVGIDLDGHVVGRVADEHMVKEQVVVVHLVVFDDLLAELAHELRAVHDTVGAERDDEPDVLLRHAGGAQLRDDGLGDRLARRRAGDVVDDDDGALLAGGALGDGLGADGGVDLLRDLRLGQGRGVIAVDLGDMHVPVVGERDRDRLVAVVAVGRQVKCFHRESSWDRRAFSSSASCSIRHSRYGPVSVRWS